MHACIHNSKCGCKMDANSFNFIGNNREISGAKWRRDFCVLFHFISFFTENSTKLSRKSLQSLTFLRYIQTLKATCTALFALASGREARKIQPDTSEDITTATDHSERCLQRTQTSIMCWFLIKVMMI